jgi:hypothetical protein
MRALRSLVRCNHLERSLRFGGEFDEVAICDRSMTFVDSLYCKGRRCSLDTRLEVFALDRSAIPDSLSHC